MGEKVIWRGSSVVTILTDEETIARALARVEGLVWDLLPAQERVSYETNAQYMMEALMLEGACVDRGSS